MNQLSLTNFCFVFMSDLNDQVIRENMFNFLKKVDNLI